MLVIKYLCRQIDIYLNSIADLSVIACLNFLLSVLNAESFSFNIVLILQ